MDGPASERRHEKAEDLLKALETVKAPSKTPEQAEATVTEAMRQNLLFEELRRQLDPDQDHLLRAASLYRAPVNEDGLEILAPEKTDHEKARKRLLDYALLEQVWHRGVNLVYYLVPPIVRELLGDPGFTTTEQAALHEKMGKYHRFQAENVTRTWSDGLEAIYHFRQAGAHLEADELAKTVSGFYYNKSNFAEAANLLSEIESRPAPPPPWWALNRYGLCQDHLGLYQIALQAYERALPICGSKEEEGTTLNNISQIYRAHGAYDSALKFLQQSLNILNEIGDKAGQGTILNNISQIYQARGDYDTALKFLQQSLNILNEIGDKAGQAITLHNMAHIALQANDPQKAVDLWAQALDLAMETGNVQGIFHVARDFGYLKAQSGDTETARKLLSLSIEVGKKAGFPGVDEIEAELNAL